jgi:hypothetical protein
VNRVGAAYVKAAPERMIWGSNWPHPNETTKPDDALLFDQLAQWAPDERIWPGLLLTLKQGGADQYPRVSEAACPWVHIGTASRTMTVCGPFDPQARCQQARARPRGQFCRHIDNAMVKAIARAFRWREMLENGIARDIAEIAAAEKINESYVGRVLRLTLLAPDIIEAILAGRQPARLQLVHLLRRFPVAWPEQRTELPGHPG